MKRIKKIFWVICCIIVFLALFNISLFTGFLKKTGIGTNFTLQNKANESKKYKEKVEKETIEISYITNESTVDKREIVIYKPSGTKGDLPLIYIPHYAAEENTLEFNEYMNHGWAVASPVFKSEYNGELTGNDLAFNNAALYYLRNLDGIDKQRIAIVGGSAGGYMALMLSELQMGTTATIANSPIANVYYNLYVYFRECDKVNKNASLFDIPIPIQLLVSKSFRVNLNNFPDVNDTTRWESLSPVGLAKNITNPIVINHFTADILVPVDQITKKYTYTDRDKNFPDDFPISMSKDYPGLLNLSLEEATNQDEVSTKKYELKNKTVDMDMPASDKLLTINIFDDGPMNSKGSHTSPDTKGVLNTIPYLEKMFSLTLKNTEKLNSDKILLLLNRYEGKSYQLVAHENIDDTLYGSLAIYKKEVVDEFKQYAENNSLEELRDKVINVINSSDEKDELLTTWDEILGELK